MAPYLLLLFFVTAAGFLFCELRKSRRSDLLFLLVTCTVMFAMSSLRGITVGVDNKLYYLPYFERMAASDISFLWSAENVYRSEPGYSLLVYLISRISDSPTVFFAVQAALAIGLTARAGVVLSSSVWICIFTFVSFGFFGYTMVTLRQQLAICIALLAMPLAAKKASGSLFPDCCIGRDHSQEPLDSCAALCSGMDSLQLEVGLRICRGHRCVADLHRPDPRFCD